jgi:hypothetical protein
MGMGRRGGMAEIRINLLLLLRLEVNIFPISRAWDGEKSAGYSSVTEEYTIYVIPAS